MVSYKSFSKSTQETKPVEISHTSYPCNGIWKISNWQDRFSNNLITLRLGPLAGFEFWDLALFNFSNSDEMRIGPVLLCFENELKWRVRSTLSILNSHKKIPMIDQREILLKNEYFIIGPFELDEPEVMNKENGWLDENETLAITFGIHVEAVRMDDKIWNFNFEDPIFDYKNCSKMITYGKKYAEDEKNKQYLHAYKLLLTHHNPTFALPNFIENASLNWLITMNINTDMNSLERCLQIAHGVRIRLDVTKIAEMSRMEYAAHLRNVVCYCEWYCIENELEPWKMPDGLFKYVDPLKWNHYTAMVMRKLKSFEELKTILEEVNIEKISREGLMQCAKFFFEFQN